MHIELSDSIESGDQESAETLKKEMETIKDSLQLLSDEVKELTEVQAENKAVAVKLAADLVAVSDAHTVFQGSVQDSQDAQAASDGAIKDQLEGLQSQLEKALSAPAKAEKDSNRCSGTCAPEVGGDGETLSLKARGGAVVFESAECKETDLCVLAQNVKALLSKYGL